MIRLSVSFLGIFCFASSTAVAHHSGATFFDLKSRFEISGEVTDMRWKNPHVTFSVTVTGANGQAQEWNVESDALNKLGRIGVHPDTIAVGDQIRVRGPISKHERWGIRAYNILLANGKEVVMIPRTPEERGWPDHELLVTTSTLENKDVSDSIAKADGIFRVWTRGYVTLINPELPLTEAAVAVKAAYNPLEDPVLQCIPTGMPAVMDVTFPIEFTMQGDTIILRLEQWDTVRTIHMIGNSGTAVGQPATREGYSVGHWEEGTLVVETSNIDWMYFDDRGTPLSNAVQVVERFTLSTDENTLHWQAITTDPEVFLEPAIQEQNFSWVPGEEIKPYNCIKTG